jgi:hypothetical protein
VTGRRQGTQERTPDQAHADDGDVHADHPTAQRVRRVVWRYRRVPASGSGRTLGFPVWTQDCRRGRRRVCSPPVRAGPVSGSRTPCGSARCWLVPASVPCGCC